MIVIPCFMSWYFFTMDTTTTSARRVSALVGHRKRPPVPVTAEPGQHQHHSNHHICHRVNALDVTCIRACHWIESKGQKFNGMPLWKLHLLAALCTPMAAVQVLSLSNLRWWCFLQPSSAFTLWQMWWFEWCRCWPGSAVTCTGGLFLWPTSVDTLLADVVVYIW